MGGFNVTRHISLEDILLDALITKLCLLLCSVLHLVLGPGLPGESGCRQSPLLRSLSDGYLPTRAFWPSSLYLG